MQFHPILVPEDLDWELLVQNKAIALYTICSKLNIFLGALFNGPLLLF